MWKFHNFSITQILRVINFGASKSAKYAIITQLVETVNFFFFYKLLEADIYKINKFRATKLVKMANLELLGSPR